MSQATTSVRRSDSSARLGRQTTDDILARAVSGSHQSEMTRVDSYVLHPVRPARRSMSSMVRGSNVVVHCYVKIYYLTNVDTRNSNFECDFLVALDWCASFAARPLVGGGGEGGAQSPATRRRGRGRS